MGPAHREMPIELKDFNMQLHCMIQICMLWGIWINEC